MSNEGTSTAPVTGGAQNLSGTESGNTGASQLEGLPPNPTGEQAKAFFQAQKEGKKNPAQQTVEKDAAKRPTAEKQEKGPEEKVLSEKPDPKLSEEKKTEKYKVPINGKETEVTLEELKRGYSHQQAANKVFQEGKAMVRKAEQVIEMLKDGKSAFEIMGKLGHDPRKLAEDYLIQKLDEEMMDPRDKALKEAQIKLKAREDEDARRAEELEKQQKDELKSKYEKEYSAKFVEAIEGEDLPATKETVAMMAKHIKRAAVLGYKIDAHEAAKLVKEDISNHLRKIVGGAKGEALLKLLGDETANKIREFDISKIKDPNQFLKTPTEQPEETKRRSSERTSDRLSTLEWERMKRG